MAINNFPNPSTSNFSAILQSGRPSINSSDHDSIVNDLRNIANTLANIVNMMGGTPINVNLSGGSYTIPANTSLIRFIQNTNIPSQTIILPNAIGDGHPIQFINYYAEITSLNFSPTVIGWNNTSVMTYPSSLRIRWDYNFSSWYREG